MESEYFFENLSRKFKYHWNLGRITGTFHEGQYIFFIISRSIVPGMKKCQAEVVDKIKTYSILKTFFRKSCPSWNNGERYGTARQDAYENITWRKRVACWITKATETNSEYVILIAFPRQWQLFVNTSMLCYTYTVFFFECKKGRESDTFTWSKVKCQLDATR